MAMTKVQNPSKSVDPALSNDPLVIKAVTLLAPLKGVSVKDVSFVTDLVNHYHAKTLTPGRAYWLKRMASKLDPEYAKLWGVAAPKAPAMALDGPIFKPELVAVGNFAPVIKLFGYAKAKGLKYPTIKFQMDGVEPLVLKLAGPTSKYHGCVMLTNGKPYLQSKWYGAVTPDGLFKPGNALDDSSKEKILTTLKHLAENPTEVASLHGQLTGHCCFCSLKLTDPKSVAVGYGPICADKFGLPWGEKKAPSELMLDPAMHIDAGPKPSEVNLFAAQKAEMAKPTLATFLNGLVKEKTVQEEEEAKAKAAFLKVVSEGHAVKDEYTAPKAQSHGDAIKALDPESPLLAPRKRIKKQYLF